MCSDETIRDLLVKIALKNDQSSFKELYFHFYQRIFSFIKIYIKDTSNAEEVANEVFVSIWKKRTAFEEIRNFTAYIYRTAKNHSLNYIAQNKLPAHIDVDDINIDILSADPNVIDHISGTEFSQKVSALISKLPPKGRVVFNLIKNDDLSYQEVADLLNISIKTVEYHMGVCLKLMAQGLNHVPYYMDKSKQ